MSTGQQVSVAMGSYMAKASDRTPQWLVVDGTDQVLGRMAVKIAMALMGKHLPTYTPHADCGDYVIVVNADKIKVSPPNRPRKRMITYHTGYFGNLYQTPVETAFEQNPARVVTLAVRRMLPKNKLARTMLAKLRVFSGPAHTHQAQNPQPFPTQI